MHLKRTAFRRAGLISIATALAATAAMIVNVPSASARPIDCSLSVRLHKDPGGLYARADVNCPTPETYYLEVLIYRKDLFGSSTIVAESEVKRTNRRGLDWIGTTEPCSDVQTTKSYHAAAFLYDGRFQVPIEVKDAGTGTVKGHC